MKVENLFFGKDCPVGKVQVEFVGCSPVYRISDYSWKPVDSAFLEIYVDGDRYRIDVGEVWSKVGMVRGLHIIGPMSMVIERTACNSCSIFNGKSEVQP